MCFSTGEKIEFRDLNDLKTVIQAHKVAFHESGRLCVSSPSTLLYENQSNFPGEIHMLDCTGSEPKPVDGKNVIQIQQINIYDMCVVPDIDRELLVAADGYSGVYAYNTVTDELEWRVEGGLDARGVTTNGLGHLFVCDFKNKCIQMFRVRDGTYMGALMRKELGIPWWITWCDANSSLVVNYTKGDQDFISVINIT